MDRWLYHALLRSRDGSHARLTPGGRGRGDQSEVAMAGLRLRPAIQRDRRSSPAGRVPAGLCDSGAFRAPVPPQALKEPCPRSFRAPCSGLTIGSFFPAN